MKDASRAIDASTFNAIFAGGTMNVPSEVLACKHCGTMLSSTATECFNCRKAPFLVSAK